MWYIQHISKVLTGSPVLLQGPSDVKWRYADLKHIEGRKFRKQEFSLLSTLGTGGL